MQGSNSRRFRCCELVVTQGNTLEKITVCLFHSISHEGQSGLPGFQIARPEVHGKYLGAARDDAALILSQDAALTTPRGEALRQLLYLFGKDETIKLIRAG